MRRASPRSTRRGNVVGGQLTEGRQLFLELEAAEVSALLDDELRGTPELPGASVRLDAWSELVSECDELVEVAAVNTSATRKGKSSRASRGCRFPYGRPRRPSSGAWMSASLPR